MVQTVTSLRETKGHFLLPYFYKLIRPIIGIFEVRQFSKKRKKNKKNMYFICN